MFTLSFIINVQKYMVLGGQAMWEGINLKHLLEEIRMNQLLERIIKVLKKNLFYILIAVGILVFLGYTTNFFTYNRSIIYAQVETVAYCYDETSKEEKIVAEFKAKRKTSKADFWNTVESIKEDFSEQFHKFKVRRSVGKVRYIECIYKKGQLKIEIDKPIEDNSLKGV